MRAALLDAPGGALRVGHLPTPEPGRDQVRVRVAACGLNPVDDQVAAHGEPTWTWPHVLGLDVAGVVDRVGPGVLGFEPGDRVAFHGDLRRPGGLAEYAIAEATSLARIPDAVSEVAAAALPCAGMSAWQAVVDRLRVGPGDTVLITGGAGGVGGYAVQLAALAGADVLATASAVNHPRVRELGARAVIDYRVEDVSARVRELTDGRGVDGVLDTVSAASATSYLPLIVHAGGIACVAGRADASALPSFTTAVSVHEIALGAAYPFGDERARRRLGSTLESLLALVAEGRLDPHLGRTVTLEDLSVSYAALRARHVAGKIVAVLP
ncbi:MAG: zinc-binding dehydrogenase [Nocardioides sp.]|uniref:zinc-binding dehydrogenase n=1 Tax=Nocardioides sp. TaxID=35761 RepID=UPI0039E71600